MSQPDIPWIPQTEDQLASPVLQWLREQGFEAAEQVMIAGRRPDIVAYDLVTDRTLVVELKLTNWRRALNQSWRSTYWSNETYVAMPEATVNRAIRQSSTFAERGVGIIAVGENYAQVVVSADPKPGLSVQNRKLAIQQVCQGVD